MPLQSLKLNPACKYKHTSIAEHQRIQIFIKINHKLGRTRRMMQLVMHLQSLKLNPACKYKHRSIAEHRWIRILQNLTTKWKEDEERCDLFYLSLQISLGKGLPEVRANWNFAHKKKRKKKRSNNKFGCCQYFMLNCGYKCHLSYKRRGFEFHLRV